MLAYLNVRLAFPVEYRLLSSQIVKLNDDQHSSRSNLGGGGVKDATACAKNTIVQKK